MITCNLHGRVRAEREAGEHRPVTVDLAGMIRVDDRDCLLEILIDLRERLRPGRRAGRAAAVRVAARTDEEADLRRGLHPVAARVPGWIADAMEVRHQP